MEIWKDVPGYEGIYQVSNKGNIISLRTYLKKAQRKDKDGYLLVGFKVNNIQKTFKVHRIVMLAFVGPSELTVNHINGIKSDNRIENLEYVSLKDNLKHARTTGLTNDYGENSKNSKLKTKDVLEIKELLKQGYKAKELSEKYKVSPGLINDINRNKRWKHLNNKELL